MPVTTPPGMIAAPACPEFVRQPSMPTRIVTTRETGRDDARIQRQCWFLAQFSKLRTPCDPRDGLKTGVFDVPRRPAPDCLSTNARSCALPISLDHHQYDDSMLRSVNRF